MPKTPRNYRVTLTVPSDKYVNTWTTLTFTAMGCSSKQAACRKAFSVWIKSGKIKNQPKTDLSYDSTFRHVTVTAI